jgi:hypothetical protein
VDYGAHKLSRLVGGTALPRFRSCERKPVSYEDGGFPRTGFIAAAAGCTPLLGRKVLDVLRRDLQDPRTENQPPPSPPGHPDGEHGLDPRGRGGKGVSQQILTNAPSAAHSPPWLAVSASSFPVHITTSCTFDCPHRWMKLGGVLRRHPNFGWLRWRGTAPATSLTAGSISRSCPPPPTWSADGERPAGDKS